METTIYTVSTNHYKYGLYALINSIRHLGIKNPVVVGTDVYLPELEKVENVRQVVLDVDWNGTNLKAYTILKHPSPRFIYFDADIIITGKNFVGELELLLDANKFIVGTEGIVSEHEYRRIYWQSIYPAGDAEIAHCWYYNAGFFAGNLATHKQLLLDWIELNKKYLDLKEFLFNNTRLPMADQDTLNAILQTLPLDGLTTFALEDWRSLAVQQHPFFPIGNFRPHAFLHCTGKFKPWSIQSIPGHSPNAYDDLWYHYLFEDGSGINHDFRLTFWQKQWFKRTLTGRVLLKLKRIAG